MSEDGPTDADRQADVRLADADREAAIAALAVHRDAGRITGEEYEDRWAAVRRARLGGDLVPVFADLPAPHSVRPAAGTTPARPAGTPVPAPAARGRDLTKLIAIMPFVALVLFFVTDTWLWFLLIPVAAILFGGTHKGRSTG